MKLILVLALVAVNYITAAPLDDEYSLIQEFDREQSSVISYDGSDLLPLKEFFNIRDWNAVDERSTRSQAADFIKEKVSVYYSIDPSKAMKELAEVGNLLRLAYSGAKGYKCSTPILEVMSTYQDLIKDSLITTSTFVEIVIKALKYHKYAIMFAEKGKGDEKKMQLSIKYLAKCSEMAGRMAVESQLLVDQSDKLTIKAVDALLTANTDYTGSQAEKKRIQESINKVKVAQKKQESIKNDLQKAIAEESRKEAENSAIASENTGLGIFVKIITIGIVDLDKSKRAEAERQAEIARKARVQYQQQERLNNAELAASVTTLMQSTGVQNDLKKAIYGLDITIKTMGKVKTIFLNAKTFWTGVRKHVESLAATQDQLDDLANDEDFHEEYIEEISMSGYSWLAVGKICRMSALAITEVNKGMDATMRNIPTSTEATQLIKELGEKILKGLKEDQEAIDKELASDKNQPRKTTF